MEEYNNYLDWKKSIEGLSDKEISMAIRDLILEKSGMDEKEKELFNDIYEYFLKYMDLGRPVSMNQLKIYLEEIKGYESVEKINMYQVMILLSLCGIQFETN